MCRFEGWGEEILVSLDKLQKCIFSGPIRSIGGQPFLLVLGTHRLSLMLALSRWYLDKNDSFCPLHQKVVIDSIRIVLRGMQCPESAE